MKRMVSFLLVLTAFVCVSFSGCFFIPMTPDPEGGMEYTIVKSNGTRVEICVSDLGDSEWTLIDVMEIAKLEGELTYEISGGMIASMEGTANAADFSSCWMLYTTDEELSNTEWGTITVGEKTLGSAIVGAEALPVVEGELYVWDYQTF